MSFQVKEPILIIGLGGVGSKLAVQARENLNSDCIIISNDSNDFATNCESIKVSTDSVINPSVQLIRGSAYKVSEEISIKISKYSTIVLMANLAGKAGSAISPIVSGICKQLGKNLVSFAIMPFKFEKDRIFNSGISFKRIKEDSACTIVLDNDSLLESNPSITAKQCHEISNKAIMYVVNSLNSTEITPETNVLSSSISNQDIEESLRDSLKMLYDSAPANSVKRSILYMVGGDNVPVGIINSVANLSRGVLSQETQVDMSSGRLDESKVVMLSSVQGMTKFDMYDPLGIIPQENTLDWSEPDCSIDCKLELYQLE